MLDGIQFEKVNSENFNEFFKLVKKLAEYEKQDPLDNPVKLRLKRDAFLDKPRFEAYLAKLDNTYIGYFIFFMTYSSYLALPTLYIEDIFVLDEHRRKGVGQKMFQFCIQQAKEKGCGRMEWCVYNWNKPAINFYKKIIAKRLNKSYYRLTREQIENLSE
jgi:GNAT superfamily N-acetyltransferase